MIRFISMRILSTLPVVFVVAVVVFLLARLIPGDPATIIGGEYATEQEVESIRIALGLDKPMLHQFTYWLGRLAVGDLGTSVFSDVPVSQLILQRAEPTISLAISTLVIALPLALTLGILSAWRAGRFLDQLLMLFAVVGFSVPVFILGFGLVYVFAMKLHIVPVQGFTPIGAGFGPFIQSMALPASALALAYTAILSRTTRSSMLEVMGEDFNRTARAKGLSEGGVLLRHTLRNASIPILTMVGISVAGLLSGSVVIENLFNIPGIGRLLIDAVSKRDYPIIQGVILVFSLIYVLINLLVDILYAVVDPRIRY